MTYPNPTGGVEFPDGTVALPGDIFAVTSGNGTGASVLPVRTKPVIDEILKARVKTSNPWVDFATGFIGELFSGFGALQEVADSIVAILTGGVIGGPIGGQSWVAVLSDWVGGFTGGLGALQDFVQQIIDKIMNGFGLFGSGFSLSSLLTQFTKVFTQDSAIPQANISGLGTALGNLLNVSTWTNFLNGLGNSAGTGAGGSTGVPAIDDALDWIGGLFGKADTAQTTAITVQQQAVTMGTIDGLTVIRTPITSTQTWNRSAIPGGCTERVKTGVALVGSGQGGGRPNRQAKIATYGGDGSTATYYDSAPASGGVGGGYVYQEFAPATVGASQTVTIGAGGAGSTTQGADGSYGGTTSFGSLLSIVSGAGGGISMSAGVVLAGGGGNGGNGGPSDGFLNSIGAPSYTYDKGQQGGVAYRTQGGSAGTGNGGNGGAGQNGPTDDDYLTGGSGGGGGAGGGSGGGTGGAGGIPGGGGGAGGGGGNSNGANGGAGGRGEALIIEFFR